MKKLCSALLALLVFGVATFSLCDADSDMNNDQISERSVMVLKT